MFSQLFLNDYLSSVCSSNIRLIKAIGKLIHISSLSSCHFSSKATFRSVQLTSTRWLMAQFNERERTDVATQWPVRLLDINISNSEVYQYILNHLVCAIQVVRTQYTFFKLEKLERVKWLFPSMKNIWSMLNWLMMEERKKLRPIEISLPI